MSAQLHHFAETTEVSYDTVTHLVQQSSSNQVSHALRKASVSPVKPITIPGLQLTAVTPAVHKLNPERQWDVSGVICHLIVLHSIMIISNID